MVESIHFLTEEEIIFIHNDLITRYGGSMGIRDRSLLLSAINTPKASFSNQFLYQDIFEMAAAYAYSLIKNHPFIDGNKRTGMATALVFLQYNDYELFFKKNEIFKLGIAIAKSEITVSNLGKVFRQKTH